MGVANKPTIKDRNVSIKDIEFWQKNEKHITEQPEFTSDNRSTFDKALDGSKLYLSVQHNITK